MLIRRDIKFDLPPSSVCYDDIYVNPGENFDYPVAALKENFL